MATQATPELLKTNVWPTSLDQECQLNIVIYKMPTIAAVHT